MSAIYFIRTTILSWAGIRSIALYGDGGIEIGIARDIISVLIFAARQVYGTCFILSFETLVAWHTVYIIFLWISRIVGQIDLHTIGIATQRNIMYTVYLPINVSKERTKHVPLI